VTKRRDGDEHIGKPQDRFIALHDRISACRERELAPASWVVLKSALVQTPPLATTTVGGPRRVSS